MRQPDVARFQLRRINPFQGLMIDAAVWREAHEYHRNQMRLHHLALHGWGIVLGLDVSVAGTDDTLLIQPGIAIDPAGNYVVVPEPHSYRVEVRQPGPVYLLIQFSEVPSGPTHPDGGSGQPTRVLEAYRIQQRDQLPAEHGLELARVHCDPARGPITQAKDPDNPGLNELDTRFRTSVGAAPAVPITLPITAPAEALAPPSPIAVAPIPEPAGPIVAPAAAPAAPAVMSFALAAHGGAGWDGHADGLRFLAREVEATTGQRVQVVDRASPAEADDIDLLYVSGYSRLALREDGVAGIARVVERGGVVIGEGCSAGPSGDAGAREFARSYAELALQIGRQLAKVERGHPVLVARHVFSSAPIGGMDNSMVLEAGGMLYSYADYGCAWQGGAPDRPLARSAVRDATELGVNLALYRRAAR